ncbi:MAG TPA: methionyl-tRNA formyltransferase, partial [Candidatus Manganitrophaceae bacterium]
MPKRLKTVFMGTPLFALPSFKALADSEEVIAVVTQPDRPKGRGEIVTPPPIKIAAIKRSLPVYQPERIRKEPAFIETLSRLAPDLIVVVAFGQILPESVLTIPPLGCVNVHASLLPKYRGA